MMFTLALIPKDCLLRYIYIFSEQHLRPASRVYRLHQRPTTLSHTQTQSPPSGQFNEKVKYLSKIGTSRAASWLYRYFQNISFFSLVFIVFTVRGINEFCTGRILYCFFSVLHNMLSDHVAHRMYLLPIGQSTIYRNRNISPISMDLNSSRSQTT